MIQNILNLKTCSIQFWVLSAFLGLIFLTGGSSRIDVQSLAVLRPATVMFLGFALFTLQAKHIQKYSLLLLGLAGAFLLTLTHVMPVPLATWSSLGNKMDLAGIFRLSDREGSWHQFTLSPVEGWQAIGALLVPLAIITLGIQLDKKERNLLLPILISFATLSGLLGLMQIGGSPTGPLYFYRIGNNGSALGFFANRNHAATLLACLIPMLAAFASIKTDTRDKQRTRELLCLSIGIFVIPLILVTGSRSGFINGVVGLAAASALYARPQYKNVPASRPNIVRKIRFLGGGIVVVLGALTILFSRDKSMIRFFTQSLDEDGRAEFVLVSLDIISYFAPFGSGAGSFVQSYQLAEPLRLLDNTYLNRAHNDWIETAVTFGAPGCLLLAAATLCYMYRTYVLWRPSAEINRSIILSRAAGIAIGMLALASLVDYPLRTPVMMTVMAVFALWFFNPDALGDTKESSLSPRS